MDIDEWNKKEFQYRYNELGILIIIIKILDNLIIKFIIINTEHRTLK